MKLQQQLQASERQLAEAESRCLEKSLNDDSLDCNLDGNSVKVAVRGGSTFNDTAAVPRSSPMSLSPSSLMRELEAVRSNEQSLKRKLARMEEQQQLAQKYQTGAGRQWNNKYHGVTRTRDYGYCSEDEHSHEQQDGHEYDDYDGDGAGGGWSDFAQSFGAMRSASESASGVHGGASARASQEAFEKLRREIVAKERVREGERTERALTREKRRVVEACASTVADLGKRWKQRVRDVDVGLDIGLDIDDGYCGGRGATFAMTTTSSPDSSLFSAHASPPLPIATGATIGGTKYTGARDEKDGLLWEASTPPSSQPSSPLHFSDLTTTATTANTSPRVTTDGETGKRRYFPSSAERTTLGGSSAALPRLSGTSSSSAGSTYETSSFDEVAGSGCSGSYYVDTVAMCKHLEGKGTPAGESESCSAETES